MTTQESKELAAVKVEVDHIKKDVTEVKESIEKLDVKFDKFTVAMEKKYASKWVEKVIIGVVVFIFTTLGGLVLTEYYTSRQPVTTIIAPESQINK